MSKTPDNTGESLTFWQHLEVLRWVLLRMIAAVVLLSVVAFCFRQGLFTIVMAPSKADFITYTWLSALLRSGSEIPFSLHIINTDLAGQFVTHIKVSMLVGLIAAIPYLLFELFRFVSPALYESEKKITLRMVCLSYLLFALGVLLAYFIIFPFTVLFLGSYQVVDEVTNMINLDSYISTMGVLLLLMGLIFELPIVSWLLARFGLIKYQWLKKYRRHAIVAVLALAAVITPSGDAFTMLITALPLYIVFEISVLVVKHTEKQPS